MKVSEIYKNAKKTNLEDLLEQFASKQGDETTIISDIKIGDAELSIPIKKVFLSNCIFEKIKFVGDMSQCSFSNCVFDNCVLNQIYGVSLEFQDCTFIDNAFNACRIPKSEFIACDFQKTDMTDCDLSRSNFSLSKAAFASSTLALKSPPNKPEFCHFLIFVSRVACSSAF